MLERFLERISASKYRRNFILKGGMLIAAMVGIDTRTTMDMDATIKGRALTASEINGIISDILSTPIDDGVEFAMRPLSVGFVGNVGGTSTIKRMIFSYRDLVDDFSPSDGGILYFDGYSVHSNDNDFSLLLFSRSF